jgi:hypothetical protein
MLANRYSITKMIASLAMIVALVASTSAFAQVSVTLPTLQGVNGQAMTLAVNVGDLTGQNVSGYQFEVQYDPAILEITDIQTAGTLSNGLTALSNSPAPGRFRVVGAGSSALSGSGALVYLTGFFVEPGASDLTWAEFSFDNGAVTPALTAGAVSVTDQIAAINVIVGQVGGRPGGSVMIPVSVDNLTGLEVPGYSFAVAFDGNVIDITGIQTSGTLSAGRNVQSTIVAPGEIMVTDSDPAFLDGGGTLVYLTGTFLDEGTSTLDLVTFDFNRTGVNAVTTDGLAAAVNAAPQFTSTPVTVVREGIRYEYLAVATDADGDALVMAATQKPTWAAFQDNGDGTGLLYGVPGNGAIGVHDVTITATDIMGVMAIQRFNISVTPNGVPVAVDDVATTGKAQSVVINVLANDTDPDADVLTVQTVSTAENGATQVLTDGSIEYTPKTFFVGTDTFTYRISDGLATAEATVTVTVDNLTPLAVDDVAHVFAGESVLINLLANDTDGDDDVLSVTEVGTPAGGVVTDNGDGTISYLANLEFTGDDVFDYTIADGFGGTATASVTITVNGPGVDGDGVEDDVEAGAPNDGDGNDDGIPDAEQNNVTSLPITEGPNASAYLTVVAATGTVLNRVESIPNPSPTDVPEGTDFPLGFLSYGVSGLQPGATTVVTIHIPDGVLVTGYMKYGPTPSNPTPHWYDFYWDGTTGMQKVGNVVSLTFVDGLRVDDDLIVNGLVQDPGSLISRSNQPPVAVPDLAQVNEDASVTISVLDNDFDVDGDALTLIGVGLSGHGSVVANTDGTVTYSPGPDFFGTDSFTYKISDGINAAVTGTVTVEVIGVDDPPVAVDDVATTQEGVSVDINIFANDVDPDNSFFLATLGQPKHGTATFLGGGVVRYKPDENYYGLDSFTYLISDGVTTSLATVAITVTNLADMPVAMSDKATTNEDTSVLINVLANDMDADNDPLSIVSLETPAHGTASITDDDWVLYVPDANYHGTDAFGYTMTDGTTSVSTTVSVVINSVNDAPQFSLSGALMSPLNGAQIVLIGSPESMFDIEWPQATDADGDPLQYRLQISRSSMFQEQFMLFDVDMEQGLKHQQSQGDLAGKLTQAGVEPGQIVDVYFRVLVSDGTTETATEVTTCPVLRGAMTDTEGSDQLPVELTLDQNYPNPFNPTTTISYALPEADHVQIEVFDMLGGRVAILVDSRQTAGFHEATFRADGLPSGIYLYRLTVGERVLTRTFTLLK